MFLRSNIFIHLLSVFICRVQNIGGTVMHSFNASVYSHLECLNNINSILFVAVFSLLFKVLQFIENPNIAFYTNFTQ